MNKTAMQKLVDELKEQRDIMKSSAEKYEPVNQVISNGFGAMATAYENAITRAEQLRDKEEREQIVEAWWAGHDRRGESIIHPSEDCDGYYNQKYRSE